MPEPGSEIRLTLDELRNQQSISRTEQVYLKTAVDKMENDVDKITKYLYEGHSGGMALVSRIDRLDIKLTVIEKDIAALFAERDEKRKEGRNHSWGLTLAVFNMILGIVSAAIIFSLLQAK